MNKQDRAFLNGINYFRNRMITKIMTKQRLHKKITPTIAKSMVYEAAKETGELIYRWHNTHGRFNPLKRNVGQ